MVGDTNNIKRGAQVTMQLFATDVSTTAVMEGSAFSVTHRRKAGSAGSYIGPAVVDGDGVVSGGEVAAGEEIGNDPNFSHASTSSGSWTTPENSYDGTDGTYATDAVGQTHDFTEYDFVVPGSNAIQGIAVKMEVSGTTAAGDIGVQLSWDGGASWTASKTTPTLATTDAVVTLGAAADTWGRTWSPSEFSNVHFAVRVTGNPSSNTVRIDELQVRVYHQSSGGGSGGGGAI